ncbi:MAG TPA: AI-2E family transporter [Herpetosiphonaceae bacterium]
MSRISVPRYLIVLISIIAALWLVEQVFQLLYRIADILLVFGLAWLLKLLLDPLIRRLERAHFTRGGAIAIAYILVIGSLISGFVWLVPQLTQLAQRTPSLAGQFTRSAETLAFWLQQRGVEIDPQAITSQIFSFSTQVASLVAQRAFNIAQSFAGVIGRIALVITVSVYMSITSGRMIDVLRPVIPPRWRDEYDVFVRDVTTTYSSYIRGYFYIVALGTLASSALLFGFRVPNAALWTIAILLLRLLPFIGGTLANILLITTLFFSLSITAAITAIVLLLIGQTLLTNVLMPRVMSRELGINPLLVLFAVLLGARIYGVAGILFSIPAAAIIATILGKAVKRYLLPLYETGGWWNEQVTVVQQTPWRKGMVRQHYRPGDGEELSADHTPAAHQVEALPSAQTEPREPSIKETP